MVSSTQTAPEPRASIFPYLSIRNASAAIEFYKRAFGATEKGVMKGPGGKVMHAELRIGDSILMLADEFPEFGSLSPLSGAVSSTGLHIYVDDADAVFDRAVKAGATVELPVADMFWGDRYGKLRDPYGHSWSIGTHKADLTKEEIEKAQAEFMARLPKSA